MIRSDEEIDEVLREIPDGEAPEEHVDDGDLLAYARQRLDDAKREAIEIHLARCAECRALVAEYGAPIPDELTSWAKGALDTRRRARWPAVAGIVAAAAVLVVVALPRTPTADLPGYTLSAPAGGVVQMRGDEADGDVFVPTSRIRWILRPDAKRGDDVRLRVFVESADRAGHVEEIAAPAFDRGASGVIRYETNAEALLGRSFGTRTVHLVVVLAGGDPTTYSGPRDAIALGPHRWLTSQIQYQPTDSKEEPK